MVRVRLIEGPLGGRFPYSNCLLVETATSKILVDTGCGDSFRGLRSKLDAVIYTHFHPDHVRGFDLLTEGIRIAAPSGEEAYKSLSDLAKRFAPGVYREWLRFAELIVGLKGVPEPSEYFELGSSYCFRDVCLDFLPAKGHLSTHPIVVIEGHVHLTDIDLTGFGPWYGNPESDPALFLGDIIMASEIEGKAYTTSHKPEVYDREGVVVGLARYVERFFDVASRIYEELKRQDSPLRPEELAGRGIIYRRYLEGVERLMGYFESVMIEKIIGVLVILGCVREYGGGFKASREGCGRLEELRLEVTSRIIGR